MFLLAVRARIVAAAMQIFGMNHLDQKPTTQCYPADSPRDVLSKHQYLHDIASRIVDNFVADAESHNEIIITLFLSMKSRKLLLIIR